ncbi:LOW QUALITY PROTEIN: hypothetical protein AAY473_004693 [Plecturocebus cupreus]
MLGTDGKGLDPGVSIQIQGKIKNAQPSQCTRPSTMGQCWSFRKRQRTCSSNLLKMWPIPLMSLLAVYVEELLWVINGHGKPESYYPLTLSQT